MTPLQWIGDAIWTSLPPIGVFLLFVLLIRSIVRADRKEREVYSKIESEMRAKRDAEKSVVAAKPGKKPAK